MKEKYSSGPYYSIILAATIWGSAGPFIKYLSLPPQTITFFRLAIPTIVLLIYFQVKQVKINPSSKMFLASGLFAVRMFLYMVGFTYASIGGAVIVLYTWPIFMSLLAVPIAKEPMDLKTGLLLSIAFIGIIFVYGEAEISLSDTNFIGLTATLLSSMILAIVNLIFRREMSVRSQYEVVFYQNAVGAVFFLPFFLISDVFPSTFQIVTASTYAILVGVIAFSLFFYGLKRLRVSKAASLSYIEVISALIMAYVFYGETLSWNKIMGGLLIIGSVTLIRK